MTARKGFLGGIYNMLGWEVVVVEAKIKQAPQDKKKVPATEVKENSSRLGTA